MPAQCDPQIWWQAGEIAAGREIGEKEARIVGFKTLAGGEASKIMGTRKEPRPTWPIKMPIKIMPHLAGASNEPIFGEVGLNFWEVD